MIIEFNVSLYHSAAPVELVKTLVCKDRISKSTGAGFCPSTNEQNEKSKHIETYLTRTETRRNLQICERRNKKGNTAGHLTKHPLRISPQTIYEFYESLQHFGEIKLGFYNSMNILWFQNASFRLIYEAYR